MENFPIRFLVSVEAAFRRQNDLHMKFTKLIDHKPIKVLVINDVKQLSSISKHNATDRKEDFEKVWNRFRGNLVKRGLSQPSQGTSDLQLAIFDLYNVSSLEDALVAYEKHIENVWKRLGGKVSAYDEKCIEDLMKRPLGILLEAFTDQLQANIFELEYMRTMFSREMTMETDSTKYYKQCLWVLCTSQHPGIKKIRLQIQNRWPDLDEDEQLRRYASEFSQLFNLVSTISKHGPGVLTPAECEPTKKDFDAYISHLAVTENEELSFVAETLYTPLS